MKNGQLNDVLKLYQQFSREVSLEGLTKSVLGNILSHTNIEKIKLITRSGDHFLIQAYQNKDELPVLMERSFPALPDDLPLSIISQLHRKPRPVLLTKTQLTVHFSNDPYIKLKKPHTVGCLPLTNEHLNVGYIYVENSQKTPIADEEFALLEMLSPQIAITLQNVLINESLRDSETASFNNPVYIPKKKEVKTGEEQEAKAIEEQFKLFASLGEDIINCESMEMLTRTSYNKVNSLMDANIFDIGLVDESKNTIEFPSTIEQGEVLPHNAVSLDDENQLAVLCWKKQQEILIGDIAEELNYYLPNQEKITPVVGQSAQSIIYIPITYRNRKIGVITTQSVEKNAYSARDVEMLKVLSKFVGIALENASLLDIQTQKNEDYRKELEDAYNTIKQLGEIGQDITSHLSIETIVETVYKHLSHLIKMPLFSLGIYNEKHNRIDVPITFENGKRVSPFYYDISKKDRLSVLAFSEGKEIVIRDLEEELNRYLPEATLPNRDESEIPSSAIFIPLRGKEGVVGVITVQDFRTNAFSEKEINIIRTMSMYVGIALDNALVYESLEEIVMERTSEILNQKEEIEAQRDRVERSFSDVKMLSTIGLTISTTLSTSAIIRTVYDKLQEIMDVSAFGIGILNPVKNRIDFNGAMENGTELPFFYHDLNDMLRYSVWSVKNRKEVFMNNHIEEYHNYIETAAKPVQGRDTQSLIYLPLETKDKIIGVMTVQSFNPNAYNSYHLDILRNMAIYAATAIVNAESYEKIERQKDELHATSQKVTSSIKYAKRIQNAVLPNRIMVKKLINESFVFFKPKDIVSGDFLWFSERGDKIFMATVDCTGHGVPGAFMSVIGNDLLNETINIRGIESPELVLDMLNKEVNERLNQNDADSQSRDGMDMTLCVINKKESTLEFAGAKNPLFIIKNGELEVIKGDKMPIGGLQKYHEGKSFTKHTLTIDPEANYYMFSDGYADQFGGEDGRKFMMKNFKQLLIDNSSKPMDKQRTMLRRNLMEWMERQSVQTDDILVVGMRFSEEELGETVVIEEAEA
ncbi:GAF domain-containing protein [Sediminitomix flava]|uniref:Serine phosphatase RsbU (Regulator of sigma subunit) n=1 Tax=Sediminitomix flava TaxID=379075 RepID=A0A315Z7D2_SEDFL|nr:GAF domain-containing protein [Sediminitomix flava]PWJ40757.1 serine phosphatase RsbU (regulator of sigma subunit) [Sediminitomix flava]